MRRFGLIVVTAVLVALFAAAIIPMWVMTAGISLPPAAIGAIVLMVIGSFAVGGGLMFLIFYSARKGYDDRVHHGPGGPPPDRNAGPR